jgi:protein phosphatase
LQRDEPQHGDVYVLCSDGLSGMVSDADIGLIVAGTNDVREACRKLIYRANERGGEDNITAVLVKMEQEDIGSANTDPAFRGLINGADGTDPKAS